VRATLDPMDHRRETDIAQTVLVPWPEGQRDHVVILGDVPWTQYRAMADARASSRPLTPLFVRLTGGAALFQGNTRCCVYCIDLNVEGRSIWALEL
jgi:hypothetical protein